MAELHRLNTTSNTAQKERATSQLLEWINKNYPNAAREIQASVSSPGMGQEPAADTATEKPWYAQIIDAATQILPAYAQYQTQKEIVDLQIDRAKRGLPPIDASQYAPPPIAVQHQFGPEITQQISPTLKMGLWIGAAVLGAIILLPLLTRKR